MKKQEALLAIYGKSQSEVLVMAGNEPSIPADKDLIKTLLLIIDVQRDFMPGGPLEIPGAGADVARLINWMYDNLSKITKIAVSLDTHRAIQIFHPCWWVDKEGNNPKPFTVISLEDVADGKWIPLYNHKHSLDYVYELNARGQKALVIWPYHCLQGTQGVALEPALSNMLYFHSIIRKRQPRYIVKGTDPDVEMYGIVEPEWDPKGFKNMVLLHELLDYDKIVIAGEAKSHCLLDSVQQIVNHYKDSPEFLKKITILMDTTSSVPGFEAIAAKAFMSLSSQINLATTETFSL